MSEGVLVGLSGGVDSALTARLLLEKGWRVGGLFCLMSDRGLSEYEDAKRVAEHLGIPLFLADLRREFKEKVLEPFAALYAAGETPNPCVLCNPRVKFAALCREADAHGYEKIATGHYALLGEKDGRVFPKKSPVKDQSYMLSQLPQEVLRRAVFPLGGQEKALTRELAEQAGLPVARKRDSQDLCFTSLSAEEYLRPLLPSCLPGNFILRETGKPVGRHRGIFAYTIGQRKNLGVALGRPCYVEKILPRENEVILSFEDPYAERARVRNPVWQKRLFVPGESFEAGVRVRSAGGEARARVLVDAGGAELFFEKPVRAVTPGQAAVFYEGEDCLGGGFFV